MERPSMNICKFWNFDNKFLVVLRFKFQRLRCILHVFFKTLFVTLFK